MTVNYMTLKDNHFHYICSIVNQLSGIVLNEGKRTLVKSRISKRIRALKLQSFEQYVDYLNSQTDSQEISKMIDVITTNKTSFFREPVHFDYLTEKIFPELKSHRIRFWSAACSSGEEPYSLAMLLREKISDIDKRDVKILATDISSSMRDRAVNASYKKDHISHLPVEYLNKYFYKIKGLEEQYKIKDNIQNMVQVSLLNLMDHWPMKGPFDVIFCRNVMIYFDTQTQEKLVNRFWDLLPANGYLFVGNAECLSRIAHKFKYVNPAIYKK